jgi:hypothetical protein
MSKQIDSFCPIDHPEIIAIALDVMITPARRIYYSALVLELADAAIARIRHELMMGTQPETTAPVAPLPAA